MILKSAYPFANACSFPSTVNSLLTFDPLSSSSSLHAVNHEAVASRHMLNKIFFIKSGLIFLTLCCKVPCQPDVLLKSAGCVVTADRRRNNGIADDLLTITDAKKIVLPVCGRTINYFCPG